MNSLNWKDLKWLKSQIQIWNPELIFTFRTNWGGQSELSRKKIRNHIYSNFEKTSKILDLTEPPKLSEGWISVSHSQNWGGLLISRRCRIGLDIEDDRRITKKLIERISASDEVQIAGNFKLLWAIKEAAWKACHQNPHRQIPKTISEIHVLRLQKTKKKQWAFEAEFQNEKSQGIVLQRKNLICAIAVLSDFEKSSF